MLVDDLGEPVPLRAVPTRVVSLVPSLTDAVETTAPGLVVGATDYCTHPLDLEVTRVGGSKYPRVEAVLELKPDLVLANAEENRREDVERIRADGIPVWVTVAAATVPVGLGSVRRLLTQGLGLPEPGWLVAAEEAWREPEPVRVTAIVPVWRKPWVVLGRDTFAGDVLHRLGVANAYADHADRYPRPTLEELTATARSADLVILPDEPYLFTATDGPEAFPGMPYALVNGRALTWCGPSLVAARTELAAAIYTPGGIGLNQFTQLRSRPIPARGSIMTMGDSPYPERVAHQEHGAQPGTRAVQECVPRRPAAVEDPADTERIERGHPTRLMCPPGCLAGGACRQG